VGVLLAFLLLLSTAAAATTLHEQECLPVGWTVIGSGTGRWECQGNVIRAHSSSGDTILASQSVYTDVTISAVVSTPNREASLVVRMQDAANGYVIIFLPDGISWNRGIGGIWVAKRIKYTERYLAYYHGENFPSLGILAQLSVTVIDSKISVSLNGQQVIEVIDTTFPSGSVGLRIYGDPARPCDAAFTNVVVKEEVNRPE